MSGSTFPKPLDTRPVPLFIQGVAVGLALALIPMAFVVYFVDAADGTCSSLTTLLAVAASVAGAAAFGVFIPIPRADALERESRRSARSTYRTPGPEDRTPGHGGHSPQLSA